MFRLRKWYMDCVAEDGTGVIAYWARLSWGVVRLRYAATLVRRGASVSESATLRPGREPWAEPDGIALRCRPLGIEGHWSPLDQPVCRTLLASDEGSVEWHCLVPRAKGRLMLADGVVVKGLGYVERLNLTILPGDLPIRELRWGRFLSDGTGVVWIVAGAESIRKLSESGSENGDRHIEGSEPVPVFVMGTGTSKTRSQSPLFPLLRLVTFNGSEMDGAEIGDDSVTWPAGKLELEPGSVLREGTLDRTALAGISLPSFLASHAIPEMHESKRLRRGKLIVDKGRVETGWAIDEVVRFGRPAVENIPLTPTPLPRNGGEGQR